MRNDPIETGTLPILSQTAEHAVRAAFHLSVHYGRGPLTARRMATALGAPENYLGKILQRLARRGIVRSSRGPRGGFELAVAPDRLTPALVIEAVERPVPQSACLLGDGPCDPAAPCAAHLRWSALLDRVRSPMVETTMAELLAPAAPPASEPHNPSRRSPALQS